MFFDQAAAPSRSAWLPTAVRINDDELGNLRSFKRASNFAILATLGGFAVELPKIRLGQPVPHHKMREDIASELIIESDEPIGFSIDGDLHCVEGPLRVSAGPRLQVIVR
jgi:hypothetical protein